MDATLRAVGFESLERVLSISQEFIATTLQDDTVAVGSNLHEFSTKRGYIQGDEGYSVVADEDASDDLTVDTYIPRGPSSSYHRKSWWDSLLSLYSEDPSQSSVKISRDLNFL